MLVSAIASFIISILILNFGIFSNDLKLDLEIFDTLASEKGKILGVIENKETEKGILANDNFSENPDDSVNIINNNIWPDLFVEFQKNISNVVVRVGEEVKKVSGAKLPVNNDKQVGPRRLSGGDNFSVAAKSAVAVDYESGALLFNYRANQIMPIASLTKLMTALVWLDHNPGWDYIYEIKREDRREGGKIYLFLGEKITIKDLFYLSLVGSANTATIALVHSAGLSEVEFVKKMNAKAIELGLEKTYFSDPIGLNNNNVSTAKEVAQIIKISLSQKDIRQATLTKEYEFNTLGGKKKKVSTTDYLLENFPNNGIKMIGGKTGYTEAAGYCFAGEFVDNDNQKIISVVLGSESSDSRFKQIKDLTQWVYDNYEW